MYSDSLLFPSKKRFSALTGMFSFSPPVNQIALENDKVERALLP